MNSNILGNARRFCLILLVLLLVASVVLTGVSNAALSSGKGGKTTWVYMGSGKDGKAYKSTNTGNRQPKYTVKVGSKKYVGYCINHDKGWGTGTKVTARDFAKSKAVSKYSKAKQDLLSYVLLYGYNSGKSSPFGNANDYYAATQTLIWQVLDGDVVMNSAGTWTKNNTSDKAYKLIKGHSYGVKCYDYIKKQMSAHVKGASFAKATSSAATSARTTMKYNYKKKAWSVTLTDKNVGNHFKQVASTGGLKMTRSGYKYTFTATKAGNYSSKLMNDKSYGTSQAAMVFDSSKSTIQSVALGATDSKAFYAAFTTEAVGTGKIVKVDDSGNKLAGFNFKVTCSSNGYTSTWKTGKDGTISAKLYPGTYTVTEALTAAQIKDKWTGAAAQKMTISAGKTTSIKMVNKKYKPAPKKVVVEKDKPTTPNPEPVVEEPEPEPELRIVKTTNDGGTVEGFAFKVSGVLKNAKKITEKDIISGASIEYKNSEYKIGEWSLENKDIIDSINEDAQSGITGTYAAKLTCQAELIEPAGVKGDGEKPSESPAEETDSEEDLSSSKDEISNDKKEDDQSAEQEANEENANPSEAGADENAKDSDSEEDQASKAGTDEGAGDGDSDGKTESEAGTKENDSDTARPEKISLNAVATITTKPVSDKSEEKILKDEGDISLYDFCWFGVADTDIKEYKTDKSGTITIGDLKPGDYTVEEAMTDAQKARYLQPDAQKIKWTGDEKEDPEPLVFENIAKEAGVKVIKKCADGQIEDVSFRIYGTTAWGDELASIDDETGEKVKGVVVATDEDGIADFGSLPAGKYTVEEIEVNLDKYLEVSPQTFEITGEEENGAVIELTFENRIRSDLTISKQDGTTGEELEGAQLRLTDKETGEIIDEWTSTSEPHFIDNLELGNVVILQELLPPEMITDENKGYLNAEGQYVTGFATAEKIEIVVGSSDKVVMIDELTQTVISKRDETTGEELPGAALEIIDPETGQAIHQWISKDEPHMVEGLTEGKSYVLRENQAPLGFDIAEEIKFTVGEDSEVVMYDNHSIVPAEEPEPTHLTDETVPNVDEPEDTDLDLDDDVPTDKTPETGDEMGAVYIAVLTLLLAISLTVMIVVIRRGRRLN